MIHMAIITLTDVEKRRLLELSQEAPELLVHRARLILAYAEGKPTLQASLAAEISRGRARFWKRQFLAQRMEIFSQDATEVSVVKKQAQRPDSYPSSWRLQLERLEPRKLINRSSWRSHIRNRASSLG